MVLMWHDTAARYCLGSQGAAHSGDNLHWSFCRLVIYRITCAFWAWSFWRPIDVTHSIMMSLCGLGDLLVGCKHRGPQAL